MKRARLSAALSLLIAAPPSGYTQSAGPSPLPSPQPGETRWEQPRPPAAPRGPSTVSGPAAASADPEAALRHHGSLKGVRALHIGEGEARLVIGGGERVVTPGSVIGTDTVKSIVPGRMVLARGASEAAGGESIVIVTFDAQGRTRVRVFATKDPTARVPAEVK